MFFIWIAMVVTRLRTNTLNDTLKWVNFIVYKLYLNLKEITEKSQGFPIAYRDHSIADLSLIMPSTFQQQPAFLNSLHTLCRNFLTTVQLLNSFSTLTTEYFGLSSFLSQPSHCQADKLGSYFPITAFKEMYYTYYMHILWYKECSCLSLKCEFLGKKELLFIHMCVCNLVPGRQSINFCWNDVS